MTSVAINYGGASPEEAFLAGPTALYGPWVQGMYTVTGCCVGGSNLQRSSANDGIVGCEILFVLPLIPFGIGRQACPGMMHLATPMHAMCKARPIVNILDASI
ncbi:unnamed protein product [Brassica rapa subsp. narinosa]|uniref:(rape) hypothetical protein n=1 Tax=Brassica napus TaxID=3708 RepID=A0A816ZF82_BRANA|nr:unnamed protein product [Brassica napus]